MDASTRQEVLAGTIRLPLEELSIQERAAVLARALKNCKPRLEHFLGFRLLEDHMYSWKLGLEKERREGVRYRRDVSVDYRNALKPKTQAIKVCQLFDSSDSIRSNLAFKEQVLYLTRRGRWLVWETHYKTAECFLPDRPPTGQDFHRAYESSIGPLSIERMNGYLAKNAQILRWIIERLIEISEETIEEREVWTRELHQHVRDQESLAQLIGIKVGR
jgi:hypothetical protein